MKIEARTILILLFALVSAGAILSDAHADGYCTHISKQDKVASDGFKLTDAASIIRQDRANYHKLGKADKDDQGDTTFVTAAARAKIPAMLEKGRLDPALARQIVEDTPIICAETVEGALLVALSSPEAFAERTYPFTGKWKCGTSTFVISPTVYNNGSEDLPVQEVAEGSDGSYTIFLSDEKILTMSEFTKKTMTWVSPDTNETRKCNRIND